MNNQQLNRPAAVSAIATLFFVAAAGCVVTAVCTFLGTWPLSSGRYLAGDLVTMGPAVFVIAAILYVAVGFGLLRLKNWARRTAIVVAAVGLFFLIAPVSSAVTDLRVWAIATNGVQVILRVIVLWYLMQADVDDAFRVKRGLESYGR